MRRRIQRLREGPVGHQEADVIAESAAMASSTAHRRRRFTGRDPKEAHRAATPLELLFDLTIVVAFSTAADELAHFVADGHAWAGSPASRSRPSPSAGRG